MRQNIRIHRIAEKTALCAGVCALLLTGCGDQPAEEVQTAEQQDVPEESVDADEEQKTYEYEESGMDVDKEESVYVLAGTDGTPDEIKVTVALRNPGKDSKIEDTSILTDIVNKEGDEEYVSVGEDAYEWENHGQDIHYEGKADPATELPVEVKVTYYLDGEEVSGEELAGADGKVKIRLDYTNNTGTEDGITPFAAVSGMLLDGEKVKHVEAENGKVKYMNGDYLVYGMTVPGLADVLQLDDMSLTKDHEIELNDYMEVSFDATDFALDFTATMFSNSVLEQENYEDITEQLGDLADKMGDAVDSTGELKEKIGKLRDGGKSLRQGADSLNEGLVQVNAALAQMAAADPSLAQISQAVSELAAGSSGLAQGVKSYTQGVEKACDSLTGDDAEENDGDSYETQEEELRELIRKIDNIKESDAGYQNFSGIGKGKTGQVSFIIETQEIK